MNANVSFETQKGLMDLGEGSCHENAIMGTLSVPANLVSEGPFPGTGVATVSGLRTTRTMVGLFQYLLNNVQVLNTHCVTATISEEKNREYDRGTC